MSITTIEWTKRPGTVGETWNPTTGCNKVDRGCKNCYAEIMHRRLQAMGQAKYAKDFLKGAVPHQDTLGIPLAWKKPRTVFVDSMSDLFHKDVPFEFIHDVFRTIDVTPQHTYLILTKRPENALDFFWWMHLWYKQHAPSKPWTPPPNLWLGTSCNDQDSADKRIPILLSIPGPAVRFLSYEPATGPLDLRKLVTSDITVIDALSGLAFDGSDQPMKWTKLDWVIAGGESGPKAVKSDPQWFRRVREDCKLAGVPFFFKQWGLFRPDNSGLETTMIKSHDKSYNVLDGETFQQFPESLKLNA